MYGEAFQRAGQHRGVCRLAEFLSDLAWSDAAGPSAGREELQKRLQAKVTKLRGERKADEQAKSAEGAKAWRAKQLAASNKPSKADRKKQCAPASQHVLGRTISQCYHCSCCQQLRASVTPYDACWEACAYTAYCDTSACHTRYVVSSLRMHLHLSPMVSQPCCATNDWMAHR